MLKEIFFFKTTKFVHYANFNLDFIKSKNRILKLKINKFPSK